MFQHASTALFTPTPTPFQKRNTLADWMFYDVTNLTQPEFDWLAAKPAPEGSMLAVLPTGDAGSINIKHYRNDDHMRGAPGQTIEHFVIAGVGSSAVGAAALARTRANFLDTPVAAIVAGYGMSDILQEALGGWFFFGAANRFQYKVDQHAGTLTPGEASAATAIETTEAQDLPGKGNDTATLLRLLREEGRDVKSLLGHSKGCLSIAFALNELSNIGGPEAIEPFADVEVITAGAVSEMPAELTNLRQYLGGIDWFGGMNSIMGVPHTRVPGAFHHLNTDLPMHMNLTEVLAGHYD